MKKWNIAFIGLIAAFGLLAQGPPPGPRGPFGGPGIGPGMMMGMGREFRVPVTGAPYSAERTTSVQQTLQGGNQIQRQQEAKIYRDGQGRIRNEETIQPPGGQAARTVITIYDPVAGYIYRLDPANKVAYQMQVRARANANANANPNPNRPARKGPAGATTQTDNLGTQSVNGVSANGTRVTETIPAGAIGNTEPIQIVRETWVSPDLKVPVMIKTSDPRFGTSVMNLANIVQAEPDASLFQVPAGYSIRSGPARRQGMRRFNRGRMQ